MRCRLAGVHRDPAVDAISSDTAGLAKGLTIAAAAAFVAVFIAAARLERKPLPDRIAFAAIAFLLGIATTLTVVDRESWATLFVYTVAVGAMCLRHRLALHAVLLCTGAVHSRLAGRRRLGLATAVSYAISAAGDRDADARDGGPAHPQPRSCTQARAELARLAVAEERDAVRARPARPARPQPFGDRAEGRAGGPPAAADQGREAAGHVSEIEHVARGALTEVREAVSGYRRMTLDDELAGARMALSAAGIEAEVERPAVTLDPTVEAVLAWTVREGATNVIRHSGAEHCSLKVTAGLGEAGVEILDDGRGDDLAPASPTVTPVMGSRDCASACSGCTGGSRPARDPKAASGSRSTSRPRRGDPRPACRGPGDGPRRPGQSARARARHRGRGGGVARRRGDRCGEAGTSRRRAARHRDARRDWAGGARPVARRAARDAGF